MRARKLVGARTRPAPCPRGTVVSTQFDRLLPWLSARIQRQFAVDERDEFSLDFLAIDEARMEHGGNPDFPKPVRADIFVASPFSNGQSSVRSVISGRADGRGRPDGAGIYFGLGFYK